MFKVTLIFLLFLQFGCNNRQKNNNALLQFELNLNKDAENTIDAAYVEINRNCDSLFSQKLPGLVDSILKTRKQQ